MIFNILVCDNKHCSKLVPTAINGQTDKLLHITAYIYASKCSSISRCPGDLLSLPQGGLHCYWDKFSAHIIVGHKTQGNEGTRGPHVVAPFLHSGATTRPKARVSEFRGTLCFMVQLI